MPFFQTLSVRFVTETKYATEMPAVNSHIGDVSENGTFQIITITINSALFNTALVAVHDYIFINKLFYSVDVGLLKRNDTDVNTFLTVDDGVNCFETTFGNLKDASNSAIMNTSDVGDER